MIETGDEPDGLAVRSVRSAEVLARIFGSTDHAKCARALAVVLRGRQRALGAPRDFHSAGEVSGPEEDPRELGLRDGDHVLIAERRRAVATTLRHLARLLELALVDVHPRQRVE